MSIDRQPYCVFKRFVDHPIDKELSVEEFQNRYAISEQYDDFISVINRIIEYSNETNSKIQDRRSGNLINCINIIALVNRWQNNLDVAVTHYGWLLMGNYDDENLYISYLSRSSFYQKQNFYNEINITSESNEHFEFFRPDWLYESPIEKIPFIFPDKAQYAIRNWLNTNKLLDDKYETYEEFIKWKQAHLNLFKTYSDLPIAQSKVSIWQPQEEKFKKENEQYLVCEKLMTQTNKEIKRLGWTTADGRAYLLKTYGKLSRLLLTEDEFLDFLKYLKNQ